MLIHTISKLPTLFSFCNVFLLDVANFFYAFFSYSFLIPRTPIAKFLVYYFFTKSFCKNHLFHILLLNPRFRRIIDRKHWKKEKVKFTRETSGEDRFFRIIASLGNYHGLSIAMSNGEKERKRERSEVPSGGNPRWFVRGWGGGLTGNAVGNFRQASKSGRIEWQLVLVWPEYREWRMKRACICTCVKETANRGDEKETL